MQKELVRPKEVLWVSCEISLKLGTMYSQKLGQGCMESLYCF